MKLGINEIKEGIYLAALKKTEKQLKQEGFEVESDYFFDNLQFRIDLFAQKGLEKRIYEFKIGHNRIRRDQLARLQQFAKNIGARLYIIYLEVPQSKYVWFEGIENILVGHLTNYPPQEICALATHFYIEDVENVEINTIVLDNEIVDMKGTAGLVVNLQFGSSGDIRSEDAFDETVEFEFTFKLKLNVATRSILNSYYKFDTSWYYE